MRAVGVNRYGGPEVLEVVELPDPEPGKGQIRIRTTAATVNPADTLLREGSVAALMAELPKPIVSGLELSGVVDAVGPDTSLTVGTPVAAVVKVLGTGRGAHAELVVCDEHQAVPIPAGLDQVAAATVPMNGMTARLAVDTAGLPPGGLIAVTGAAGAVGAYVVALAAHEGLRVAGVARASDEQRVRKLGAEWFAMDVTDLPEPHLGTRCLLWGPGLPVEEVAAHAGTISYEMLCGVRQRVPHEAV